MSELTGFVEMSKYAGMREDLVQAGGGNSSVKLNKGDMLIKSSGIQLAEIEEDSGYSTVSAKVIANYFEKTPLDKISISDEKMILDEAFIKGGRPSIETFLHAFTDKYTLHTHATLVNVLSTRRNGMRELEYLFPDAMLIGYEKPGIGLAKEYFSGIQHRLKSKMKVADITFLKNHGVVVSGKTAIEVIEKTEYVVNKIEKYLEVDNGKYKNTTEIYNYLKAFSPDKSFIVYLCKDYDVVKMAAQDVINDGFHQICPDCIVYCGKRLLILNERITSEEIKSYMDVYGFPTVIVYRGHIYICSNSIKKAKEIESVLSFSAQIVLMNRNEPMDRLSEQEQAFLLNWDAEKYRQNLK